MPIQIGRSYCIYYINPGTRKKPLNTNYHTSVGCMASGDKRFVMIAILLLPHFVPKDENKIEYILVMPLMAGYDSIMCQGNSGANPDPDVNDDKTNPI
jgi:hypothetical protein